MKLIESLEDVVVSNTKITKLNLDNIKKDCNKSNQPLKFYYQILFDECLGVIESKGKVI